MRDYIVRAITADGFVKAAAICSTGLVEQARQMHQTTPTATAALGRVLTPTAETVRPSKWENSLPESSGRLFV